MNPSKYSVIIGSGKYIPTRIVKNADFLNHKFLERDGSPIEKPNEEIIQKFEEITTIQERRYVKDEYVCSDIAYFAAQDAIRDADIDGESLDYIIVAQNFGDIRAGNNRTDIVPSLAARVKYKLGIENPNCVAYDLPFGCPGWVEAVIQANYYLKSGDANRALIIGADVLSRVCDPHDRDSMIYADGAGAVILEASDSDSPVGILAHKTRSDTKVYAQMLKMDQSYSSSDRENLYLKMQGRKLYHYALTHVPSALVACLEKANVKIVQVSKILIHQANGKMDDAIIERFYHSFGKEMPQDVMPMTISWLGNSSVATIPTLYDLIAKGEFDNQSIEANTHLLFASVGAGMNINAFVYKVP